MSGALKLSEDGALAADRPAASAAASSVCCDVCVRCTDAASISPVSAELLLETTNCSSRERSRASKSTVRCIQMDKRTGAEA